MHLLVAAALYAMYRLGLWQWGRGEATGSLRNYSYGVEWYLFAALTLVGWVKFCVDEQAAAEQAASGGIEPEAPAASVLPVAKPVSADEDPELAAWNARFAELARRDAESAGQGTPS